MDQVFTKVSFKKACQRTAALDLMFSVIALVDLIWMCTVRTLIITICKDSKEMAKVLDFSVPAEVDTVLGSFGTALLLIKIAHGLFTTLAMFLYFNNDSIQDLKICAIINFILMILSILSMLLFITFFINQIKSICVVKNFYGEIRFIYETQNPNNGFFLTTFEI